MTQSGLYEDLWGFMGIYSSEGEQLL